MHETGGARRSRFFLRIAIRRSIGDAANESET